MTPSAHAAVGSDDADSTHARHRREALDLSDLLAGLWQEAPFARLPDDAPSELQDLVQDIENPRRVYAIHKATRRHDFQLLVDRYVFQLRNGCGSPQCTTSTCFTCRKRLAGKAPIRRYTPTSARTLAVYLASQDSPEKGLCPHLCRSRDPPAATNTLIFSARFAAPPWLDHKPLGNTSYPGKGKPKPDSRPVNVPASNRHGTSSRPSTRRNVPVADKSRHRSHAVATEPPTASSPKLTVHERSVSKDYRSFAAATFGTVAFKMLEWLTPQGIELMSKELRDVAQPGSSSPDTQVPSVTNESKENPTKDSPLQHPPPQTPKSQDASKKSQRERERRPSATPATGAPPQPKNATKTRRTSRGSFCAPSSPKSTRRASVDSRSAATTKDESKPPSRTATLNGFHLDKRSRTAKIAPSVIARAVPELPLKSAILETVPCLSPPVVNDVKDSDQGSSDAGDGDSSLAGSILSPATTRIDVPIKEEIQDADSEQDSAQIDCLLPQSLRQLNVEVVDFICDVFQEDHTTEKLFHGPFPVGEPYPSPHGTRPRLARRHQHGQAISRKQWKAFNEQTIFDVLSNPQSLVRSFTTNGKLFDSHTLWYCMLRMTRVAPSLVMHSLWLAARSLFAPPESLKSVRTQARPLFGGNPETLCDFEAGCILSVCLHALVAAAPYVSDAKTLYEMSRVRSHGLVLSGSGIAARPPPSMCLEYDDVFSNELALRLARRLFCAITARQCFADIANCDIKKPDSREEGTNLLQPLIGQLDLLNSDPIRLLEFTPAERLLHETRVPTLLLDWARAVLLREWNGRAEFACDGPFYGALSLMATLFEHRNMLLLGDVQFRVDFLSDRLDSMETPVGWTTFTSTRQKRHLLDYPYLFSPEALVTWFRAINFSRMSRTFEESSSLKTRMCAIIDPGSLVTNPHHKTVLQDLLKTASSKFLVLDIRRKHVVQDAFDQLWRRQERELLRPLKIHLGEDGGEEGFDSGGVQQEFFRMAIAECLDPRYGAFTIDDRTRAAWFAPSSIVEEWKFEMVGLLVSLALYNGLTLPVTFPKALYRKLLGQPVEQLYHIADGWPDLASGLTTLLEWDEKDGLVEDVFARTYEFSVAVFGSNVTRQMTKDGSTWPQGIPPAGGGTGSRTDAEEAPLVTNANRDEYVSDYVRYLTDISVRPQYAAFERGFRACLDVKSLSLLTPPILQSMVEGVQEIDISELRRYTRYVGWDSSHRTIKDFWSIVKRFDDRMKRKLLEFVTASDRVPVGGMVNLQFIIQRNGEQEGEGGHLPTAYTCYGTLLLPEYRDKEVLRERLCMALENAQGFGFA
ncbi:hypothetical protein HIM_06892 [Hirsutella minnesotensis 3608]|uniref:HECT-type E3 ubiquitin transferase n=1 Tax=Hirsutella minnesotensis 3608 TaxID=1043627 RepID=A0A0F8A4L2_9HYPO|nr:hypothetical protein HIM_06892 [Hirsutella minnesotensis 3608]